MTQLPNNASKACRQGCLYSNSLTASPRCLQSGCQQPDYTTLPKPTVAHGAPIPVAPTTAAKQTRKAIATLMLTLGLGIPVLVDKLPELEKIKGLPAWIPVAIGIVGGIWQAWKQHQSGKDITTTNYSGPSPIPLPEGVPMPKPGPDFGRYAEEDIQALPAETPLSPDLQHAETIAEDVFEEDRERTP